MGISTTEQETTINYSRNGGLCSIWTCDSTVITKLDKIYKCKKEHVSDDGSIWAKEYEIPKGKLSFRSLVNKPISPARRDSLRKAAEKARQSRQNQFIA